MFCGCCLCRRRCRLVVLSDVVFVVFVVAVVGFIALSDVVAVVVVVVVVVAVVVIDAVFVVLFHSGFVPAGLGVGVSLVR